MKAVQTEMYTNLMIAMDRFKKLSPEEKRLADSQIRRIISLKHQMESLAASKGYSQACKSSIPICKGDCCKWHFPRNITPIDFFISIFHMPSDQRVKFTQLLLAGKKNHCPILLETGCFLSFEQRPVTCTNAYPCFADRSYWIEKEMRHIEFKKAMGLIKTILS